jgi:hypothetical protein
MGNDMSAYDLFEHHNDEALKFDRVEVKNSNRPDLHAFILLDKLPPGKGDIVCCAEHDQIWFNVSSEQIETISEDHIIELLRCGIYYDNETDSLYSFV